MKIKVMMPWNNLGALGVRIGRLYFDIYSRRSWGGWLPGLFVCYNGHRRWFTPRGIRRG